VDIYEFALAEPKTSVLDGSREGGRSAKRESVRWAFEAKAGGEQRSERT
jgi:hypothetical protein